MYLSQPSPYQFDDLKRCLAALVAMLLVLALGACGEPWVPTGGWQGTVSADCEAQSVERKLMKMERVSEQTAFIKAFLDRCGDQLNARKSYDILQLYRLQSLSYDYQKLRVAKKILYKDPAGIKVRGTLFLKPGKRPLVIVKCGVQCEEGSSSLGHILMNLYDEGPFHVLLLPSFTGETFERENGIMAFGGFDEGRQIVRIAKWLRESKDGDRISEVHAAGVSLGGHSALYAGLYGGYQTNADGTPVIASVFAGCPAVDLEKSVTTLFSRQSGLVGKIFLRNFWTQVAKVASVIPGLKFFVEDPQKRELRAIPGIIERGSLDYYKRATRDPDFFEAPLLDMRIRDREDLWDANRFQDFARQVKVPVVIWASTDDRVVTTAANSAVLADVRSPYISTVVSDRGSHCAFSDAYSWRSMGAILRGTLIARSPSLKAKAKVQRLRFVSETHLDRRNNWIAPDAKRKLRVLQWRAVAGQKELDLIFYGKKNCLKNQDASDCRKGYSLGKIAYGDLGLRSADRPKTALEAQVLTRWLNANAWVWGAQRGVLDSREAPSHIEWTSYE